MNFLQITGSILIVSKDNNTNKKLYDVFFILAGHTNMGDA